MSTYENIFFHFWVCIHNKIDFTVNYFWNEYNYWTLTRPIMHIETLDLNIYTYILYISSTWIHYPWTVARALSTCSLKWLSSFLAAATTAVLSSSPDPLDIFNNRKLLLELIHLPKIFWKQLWTNFLMQASQIISKVVIL